MIDKEKFDSMWRTYEPSQYKSEYFHYLDFVHGYFQRKGVKKPKVLEIGIRFGAQSWYYKEFLNANYYAIDMRPRDYEVSTIPEKYPRKVNIHPETTFIEGRSDDPEVFEKIRKLLAGEQFDLVFIDAEHSYQAAYNDWNNFGKYAKHLCVFHDVNILPDGNTCAKLFKDMVKSKYPVIEYKIPDLMPVQEKDGTEKYYVISAGIGVVLMDREPLVSRNLYQPRANFDRVFKPQGIYIEYEGGKFK